MVFWFLPFLLIVLDGFGRILQISLRQYVHIVAHIGIDEVMRNHGVEQTLLTATP
jgi:hypothetical protein